MWPGRPSSLGGPRSLDPDPDPAPDPDSDLNPDSDSDPSRHRDSIRSMATSLRAKAFTSEQDDLLAKGWPELRILTDERVTPKKATAEAMKGLGAGDPYFSVRIPPARSPDATSAATRTAPRPSSAPGTTRAPSTAPGSRS